ncbi:uncharacterized protein LOC127838274 [Dreissena polymorpha]|uniref:uncharacterized protein LOC127838274 n=1 Tax=Dreissena polymorpha TaxID=45954 RepID=UPI0022647AF3|nr:uncharacterized protein LOC127838274 [Dreissena polymorpha]
MQNVDHTMRSGFNSSGCMVCRLSVPYNENESHVPFLECGDHIEILMKNQLTYHHAIVEEFEYLGDGKGKIKVIDVSKKKKKKKKKADRCAAGQNNDKNQSNNPNFEKRECVPIISSNRDNCSNYKSVGKTNCAIKMEEEKCPPSRSNTENNITNESTARDTTSANCAQTGTSTNEITQTIPESKTMQQGGCMKIRRRSYKSNKKEKTINLKNVRRVDYQKRKFNKKETFERAKQYYELHKKRVELFTTQSSKRESLTGDEGSTRKKLNSLLRYNLFVQNCEHFAAACVNGDDCKQDIFLDKSTSLQAFRCFRNAVHVFFVLCMTIANVLNVLIYTQFVEKPGSFKHLQRFSFCVINEAGKLNTDCDWSVASIYLVIIFVTLSVSYTYVHMKRSECYLCYSANIYVLFVKSFLIYLYEVANISTEKFWSFLIAKYSVGILFFYVCFMLLQSFAVYFLIINYIEPLILSRYVSMYSYVNGLLVARFSSVKRINQPL